MLKTYHNNDFRAFLRKAKTIFVIFNIYGCTVLKKYKGCALFYKLINSSRKKTDCWLTPKKSMEKDFMNIDTNFSIDRDEFSESLG